MAAFVPEKVTRRNLIAAAATGSMLGAAGATAAVPETRSLGSPPPGFSSGMVPRNGMHYVRGGHGPAVVLLHGFPEDWVEYRTIMPRLAERFTVVAVDLPGLGRSAPSPGGYDAATLASVLHTTVASLELEHAYLVAHDIGGIVGYAYLRRFPETLRGAMILDVPIPGIAGWEQSTQGAWHIGFIQSPGQLAERMVAPRPDAFLGWCYDQGKFGAAERAYYLGRYGAQQLHAAFEVYRAFPGDGEWNAGQTSANQTRLTFATGEKSPFFKYRQTFIDGFRAKGFSQMDGATIPAAGHYIVADNPEGTADLIMRLAAR